MQNQIRLQAAPPDINTRNKRELICAWVYRAPSALVQHERDSADVLEGWETRSKGSRIHPAACWGGWRPDCAPDQQSWASWGFSPQKDHCASRAGLKSHGVLAIRWLHLGLVFTLRAGAGGEAFSAGLKAHPTFGPQSPPPYRPPGPSWALTTRKSLCYSCHKPLTHQLPARYDPRLPSYFSTGSLLKRKHHPWQDGAKPADGQLASDRLIWLVISA